MGREAKKVHPVPLALPEKLDRPGHRANPGLLGPKVLQEKPVRQVILVRKVLAAPLAQWAQRGLWVCRARRVFRVQSVPWAPKVQLERLGLKVPRAIPE